MDVQSRIGLPLSIDSRTASSLRWRAISLTSLIMIFLRSVGCIFDQ